MKELTVFEGKNVEVLELEGKVLFNPRDCGMCLDLKDSAVRMAIKKMNEKQVIKLTNSNVKNVNFRKIANRGENFLTELGVCQLAYHSYKISYSKKIEFLKSLGIDKGFMHDRKEIVFLDMLEEQLKAIKITDSIRQFSVLGKRIDIYIPSLNIAIEYDELTHSNYTYENEELRQELIEKELGCNFIRVSESKSDLYNCAIILRKILKL